MAEFDLAKIQALASSGDYGGAGVINASTAALGLSAILLLNDYSNWQGAGYDLTDAEKDDIDAIVAQYSNDLMVSGDTVIMPRVQVSIASGVTILNNTETVLVWDVEIYDTDDMHSQVSNKSRLTVVEEGLYQVDARIDWQGQASGERNLQILRYDDSEDEHKLIARSRISAAGMTSDYGQTIAFQDYSDVDDYYYVKLYQNSGISLLVAIKDYSPIFAVSKLSA